MGSIADECLRDSADRWCNISFRFIGGARGDERLEGHDAVETVLDVPDLATAQRERRRWLSANVGGAALVLLRVEAVVAESVDRAFAMWADGKNTDGSEVSTVQYVGTPTGLAGLISDVVVADVADGVIVVPLPGTGSSDLIAQQTIPWLKTHCAVRSIESSWFDS